MSLITVQGTVPILDSSLTLSLATSMNENQRLESKLFSDAKDRNHEEMIRVQREKVGKMEKQISEKFKGGMFNAFLGLVVNICSSALNFAAQNVSLKNPTNPKATLPFQVGQNLLGFAKDMGSTLNPFARNAESLSLEIEDLQTDSTVLNREVEKAEENKRQADEATSKSSQTMRELVQLNNQIRSTISRV